MSIDDVSGGYMPGSVTAKVIPRPSEAKRKRAWSPVRSTLSNDRIWLKHYWDVKSYQLLGSNGLHLTWGTKTQRLTDEEYLLYTLGRQ